MFEIDLAGFKQLMGDRPKWHFARELISNSLDEESVSTIDVLLEKSPRYCTITVTDDGAGFEKLSDAYTLFGETRKRHNAEVRGRFNLGEKELASIAKEMVIETTTGCIEFKDGKRRRPRRNRENGTMVRATIAMNQEEYDLAVKMVNMFLVPSDKTMTLNGEPVETPRQPAYSATETLPTVLVNKETNRMARTARKTQVDIYRVPEKRDDVDVLAALFGGGHPKAPEYVRQAWLFELGIPVQPIACEYDIDVNQKIPLNANRDTVLDSYLEKVYGIVLNQVHSELNDETVSSEWVRIGQKSDLASDTALDTVRVKRYGENSVLWSSNPKANEMALEAGYRVIGRNELSAHEKSRFGSVGLVNASVEFKMTEKEPEPAIPETEWTPAMQEFATLHRNLSQVLTGKDIAIEFDLDSEVSARAQTDGLTVRYHIPNMAHVGSGSDTWDIRPRHKQNLGTLVHELAHDQRDLGVDGLPHGEIFWRRLQEFTAILVEHSLEDFL